MTYYLTMSMSESSTNAPANQSNISWYVYLNSDNSQSYANYPGMTLDYNIGGQTGNVGVPSAASCAGGATPLVASGTQTITHNTDGSLGTVSGSVTFNGQGGYSPGTISASASCGSTDFVRIPTTPTFSSGPTRTTGTSTVNMTLSTVTNYGTSLKYYVDYSKNSGSYTGQLNSTSTSFSFTGLTLGSSYVFRGYASDTEGTSTVVTSGSVAIPNVPGLPTLTVGSPLGRAVLLTATGAATNGATIDYYYAQLSSDNGITWKNAAGTLNGTDAMAVSGANFTTTYSNLQGGATFLFRVYAHNQMGNGAIATSPTGTFIPSGGHRYDGSNFIAASTAQRYDAVLLAYTPIVTAKKCLISGVITNAVGSSGTVTYTAANQFVAGNVVTITNVTPTAYNLTNAVIATASPTQFTITNGATGTYSSSTGTALSWADLT